MDSKYTISLKDFINSRDRNEIQFSAFDIKDASIDKEIFMSKNLLHDYLDDLIYQSTNVYLTDDEFNQYKYRPRLLANRVYGNPNYYYIILLVNNLCDEKEFDRKKIKLIKPDNMINILSSIYNANSDLIKYHDEYIEEIEEENME